MSKRRPALIARITTIVLCATIVLFVLPVATGLLPMGPKAPVDGTSESGETAALEADDSTGNPVKLREDASSAEASPDAEAASVAPENVIALDNAVEAKPIAHDYLADTVLVRFADGTPAAAMGEFLKRVEFAATKDVSDQDVSQGFVTVALAPETDVSRACATLLAQGGELIASVQPNFVYTMESDQSPDTLLAQGLAAGTTAADLVAQSTSINDPYASQQWALDAVNAYEAWDTVKANKSVTVAVLDNGCAVAHPDLRANIAATYNAVKSKSSKVVTDVSHLTDDSHGTHVAGIIAAQANNGVGVAGVSYNAKVLPVQVMELNDRGVEIASTSTIANAYNYLIQNKSRYNIRVANMSLGATMDTATGDDLLLIDAAKRAHDKGILTVVAANNYGSSGAKKGFPVDFCPTMVGVINLDSKRSTSTGEPISPVVPANLKRYYTSNYNLSDGETGKIAMTKDISAPGTKIYSTEGDSDYGKLTGTSMAAPCVSGIAALVACQNPDLTSDGIASVLYSTAADLGAAGFDAQTGYGCVDAQAAVENADAAIVGNTTLDAGETSQFSTTKYAASACTWASSDSSVATVSAKGLVKGVSYGSAMISAKCNGQTIVQTVTVEAPATSLSGAFATLPAAYYDHTGKAVKPAPTVRAATGELLKEGVDYKLSYENNVKPGTATVKIKGTGSYTGVKELTFTIVAKPSWKGPTRIPLGAQGVYTVKNGTVEIKSGATRATLSKTGKGASLKGKETGYVVLALRDTAGRERASKIVEVYSLKGSYYVRSAKKSSIVLGVEKGSSANGANVRVEKNAYKASQKFKFTANKKGLYYIKSVKSGKCVQLASATKANNANVIQGKVTSKKTQRWTIKVDASNRLSFVNAYSGKALDIAGHAAKNAKNVNQQNAGTRKSQKWTLSQAF